MQPNQILGVICYADIINEFFIVFWNFLNDGCEILTVKGLKQKSDHPLVDLLFYGLCVCVCVSISYFIYGMYWIDILVRILILWWLQINILQTIIVGLYL